MHTQESNSSREQFFAKSRENIEKSRVLSGIPGLSVGVLHKGELVFAEGFGKRNENDSFHAETLVPIGSLTKAFTATAIGELVAEGKLDWDKTPVSQYLPEFQLKHPHHTAEFTLSDLLSHRTGMASDDDISFYYTKESMSDVIKRLKHADIPVKTGSKRTYCNTMFSTAGEAAARVANVKYEDLVRDKVLRPLGLDNTGFSPTEMKGKSDDYAMPYTITSLEDALEGKFRLEQLDEDYMTLAPSGDMYSNVIDMLKWGRVVIKKGELDGKQVLNKESVQRTLKPETIDGRPAKEDFGPISNYGFGWMIQSYKGQTVYTHSGGVSGFGSYLALFPDQDLVVAVMQNAMYASLGNLVPYYFADELVDLPRTQDWLLDVAPKDAKKIYDWVFNQASGNIPEKIPDKSMSHPLKSYVGEYLHPLHGSFSVRLSKAEGKNVLEATVWNLDATVEHLHYDAFVLFQDDAMLRGKFWAIFRTQVDGTVGSVAVEYQGMNVEFKRAKK
ncbi:hypothetical protein EDD11_003355 [Mortierella claussenii]|nr:hypothetical protein EDD11_003355 [Mortierella claussenii]